MQLKYTPCGSFVLPGSALNQLIRCINLQYDCHQVPKSFWVMGDPTDTELAGLNTIDETAAFTQLDGAENDVRTSRGSFLQLLGFNAGARMAALGMISEADVDAALAAWKIATVLDADGRVTSRRDPTMAELGKAKLIARICRQKIGLGVSTTGVSTTVVASSVAARKIKLSQVLSQVDDTEINVLTEPQLVERCTL